MVFKKRVKLLTHNGTFHADDCLAAACLQIYFREIKKQNTKIIRTRDLKIIEQTTQEGGIVFDVGRKYIPAENLFDHHQPDPNLKRKNGIPYSSFGLIWKHFGLEIIDFFIKQSSANQHNLPKTEDIDVTNVSSKIQQEIDEQFVQQICAGDTGFIDFRISIPESEVEFKAWGFDDFVKIFQFPEKTSNFFSENDPENSLSEKELLDLFQKVVKISESLIRKLILRNYKQIQDFNKVKEIYEKSKNKDIIILEQRNLSWKKFLIENTDAKYVIYQSYNLREYHVQAVNVKQYSKELRKPFPADWLSMGKEELSKKIDIPDIVFVHKAGYLAVVENLESAKKLAEKALKS